MSREFWWSSGPHPTFQIGRLQQLFLTWPPESVPSVPRAFCKKIQYFSVEIFCWVCRWKGSVPIYTTRAEQAFEPHHYSDSFLLNMKWFCGQPAVSRSQLNREPATPLLISIDKKFASPLCPVSLRRRRRKQDLERGLSYLKGVQRASKGMPKFYLTSELWQSF